MSEAPDIPNVCYHRATEQMERWGITAAKFPYLGAVVDDVLKAAFAAKEGYDQAMLVVARLPSPEQMANCQGCGQKTIYEKYCSDCQVDVECGHKPGTFYVEEGIKAAEYELENGG